MPECSTRDYWNTVKSIATECNHEISWEEYPDVDDDARAEYIWESVDGNYYIVYNYANETVLDATNNKDAVDEYGLEPTTDWVKLRMQTAFFAMTADVWDKVREQDYR